MILSSHKNVKKTEPKKPKEQQRDTLNVNLTGINYMQQLIISYYVGLQTFLVTGLHSDRVGGPQPLTRLEFPGCTCRELAAS